MKRPPKGLKDSLERQKAGNKVLIPLSMLMYILVFFGINDTFIKVVVSGVLGFLVYVSLDIIRNHNRELSGKSLEEFNRLYVKLFTHAASNDIVEVTLIIKMITDIMETDFQTGHKHLQHNSFIFGSLTDEIEAMVFLLHSFEAIGQVYAVLHTTKERLSEFLTSPHEHIRQAAIVQMSWLQKGGRGERTLDLP